MKKIFLLTLILSCLTILGFSQKLKKIKKVDSKAKIFESYEVLKDSQSIKHGKYLFRFAGKVQVQGQYTSNLKTGEWIYTPDENVKIIGLYKEDNKDGEWKYYKNDKLISVLNYVNGKRLGKSLGYHENGKLACELEHSDSGISGVRKAYFNNGQLKSIINYKKGKFDGDFIKYSKNGELLYTLNYKDGITFNLDIETENLDSILVGGDLKDGNGQFIIYIRKDGKKNVKLIRTYKEGKLNGQIKGFNHKGELWYRGQYMKGYMVGMWNFDINNPRKRKDVAYTFADSIITDSTKHFLKSSYSNDYVEESPRFDGNSPNQFRYFISKTLKYPEQAYWESISGKVYTTFEINNIGKVVNVDVVKSVNQYLDAESKRVVESSPYWIPGFQDQIPVSVKFTFPIVFQLQ